MRRRPLLAGIAAAIGIGAGHRPAAARTLNGFDLRGALVPMEAILAGGPPRDGIPAIDRPRFVAAAAARLAGSDRVLGIQIGPTARAYPIRILNWHEIVNDQLEGQPVAITYCPLCGTGVGFDARVAGQPASFGVSGLLYNSDVLLYDRRTESLWSQILSRAVTGPLKGTALASLPITHTTWAAWRERHPRTEVLSTETGHSRDYEHDPYAGYDKVPQPMFDVQHRDERVPVKAWVLGLVLDGKAKAYPFETLAKRADASGRLFDQIGGRRVQIRFDRQHASAEAYDAEGRALPSIAAFWFAWVAFHPRTELLAER
jgi:hypothetical protein